MENVFKTADGHRLENITFSAPIWRIVNVENKFKLDETVALSIQNDVNKYKEFKTVDEINSELLNTYYLDKEKAEAQVFKINKLRANYKIFDLKIYYKDALKILSNFTDDELFNFVNNNKKVKNGRGN